MVISSLDITNFKCFKQLRLPLKTLTLLTGFNGGGKSSAIQPLLLLAQTLRDTDRPSSFALNGPLVHLGTVGDVLPSDTTSSQIEFLVSTCLEEAKWSLATKAGERFLRVSETGFAPLQEGSISSASKQALSTLPGSLAQLIFLSAVREGTADAFPIPDLRRESLVDVGIDGRFAPYWYDQYVDDEVRSARCHPKEPGRTLRKQLDAWLGTLFPGAQAHVQLIQRLSLLSLQFRLSDIGAWRRPANIGYGLTYSFPIIVTLLAAGENQLVVVDSPEAHLHPFAQSQMGMLLAKFAAAGVQIIVETHSDHLLNGVRLAIKTGVIGNSNVVIHFFTGAGRAGHGVLSPALDAEGRINDWPEGFFDQFEKDLARLAGWDQ
jgi:CRISPR-associated Cas5-like protein